MFLAACAVAVAVTLIPAGKASAAWWSRYPGLYSNAYYPTYSYYYGYPGAYYTPPYYWSGQYYVNPYTSGYYYGAYSPWTNQYYYQYRVYPTFGWWY
jgi:hypothetical protein